MFDLYLGRHIEPARLKLKDLVATPRYCKPKCVPYGGRDWLEAELKEMVENGLIAKSQGSAINSRPHIVKKKQPGKYRLTVDYRYLNGLLTQNRWPLRDIRTVLKHPCGSKYVPATDCKSGF